MNFYSPMWLVTNCFAVCFKYPECFLVYIGRISRVVNGGPLCRLDGIHLQFTLNYRHA